MQPLPLCMAGTGADGCVLCGAGEAVMANQEASRARNPGDLRGPPARCAGRSAAYMGHGSMCALFAGQGFSRGDEFVHELAALVAKFLDRIIDGKIDVCVLTA